MANPIPVLDLNTLTERPLVAIDGLTYPLRAVEDFSILEHQTHVGQVQRFAALMNIPALTATEETELAALLKSYCQRVLAAPPEVHAKLSDVQRLQVVMTFVRLLGLPGRIPGALTAPAPATGTGATSSPASPGSTAGIH